VSDDPNAVLTRYENVPAVANVYMESIELVSDTRPDQLFNDIVAIMRGRITRLVCDGFPDMDDGDVVVVNFDLGNVVEHAQGVDFEEAVAIPELPDMPMLSTIAPRYEMHYHFTREQLFAIASKGGFVPGYARYAVPSNILNREWQQIPVALEVTRACLGGVCPNCGQPVSAHVTRCPNCDGVPKMTNVHFFAVQNAAGAEVDAKSIGYSIDKYLVMSEEMRTNPDRVVGMERTVERDAPDMMKRSEIEVDAVLSLNEELEATQAEAEQTAEATADEQYMQDQQSTGYEGYVRDGMFHGVADDPRGMVSGTSATRGLDDIAIEAILRGHDGFEAVMAAQNGTVDGRQGSRSELDQRLPEVDERDMRDARRALDNLDDMDGGSRSSSASERQRRVQARQVRNDMIADMQNDGASTIAEAQTNAMDRTRNVGGGSSRSDKSADDELITF
jgi:hypothetical protein